MASNGPRYAGTGANFNDGGNTAWTNPTNVQGDTTATAATCAPGASGQTSQRLRATNYGFAIPTTATITGIQIEIERQASTTNRGGWATAGVQVMKGGVDHSDVGASTANWTATKLIDSWGADGNMLGATLTPADVNGSGFGTSMKFIRNGNAVTASIFRARITVFYTTTGSISADAVLRATRTVALTADAIKRQTQVGGLTADAIKRKTQSQGKTIGAAAVIRATMTPPAWFPMLATSVTDDFNRADESPVAGPSWDSALFTQLYARDAFDLSGQKLATVWNGSVWQGGSIWASPVSGDFETIIEFSDPSIISHAEICLDLVGDPIETDAIVVDLRDGNRVQILRHSSIQLTYNLPNGVAGAGTLLGLRRLGMRMEGWVKPFGEDWLRAGSVLWDGSLSDQFYVEPYITAGAGHPQAFADNFRLALGTPSGFYADAIVRREQGATLTADAILRREQTGSLTIDAVIAGGGPSTVEGSFTADAIVRREQAGALTADAVLFRTQAAQLTADAVIQAVRTAQIAAEAIVKRTASVTFSADAVLRATSTGSVTADAVIRKTVSAALTADAVILRPRMGGFAADAILLSPRTGSVVAEAIIRTSRTGVLTADATVQRTQSATLTADAILRSARESSVAADAVIRRTRTGSLTADAWVTVPGSQVGGFTADAVIRRSQEHTLTADAVVRITRSGAIVADALLRRISVGSFGADAVVLRQQTGAVTAQAVIRRERTATIAADAILLGERTGSFTVDAVIAGISFQLTADAVIRRTQTRSFTIDAIIGTTEVFSATIEAEYARKSTIELASSVLSSYDEIGGVAVSDVELIEGDNAPPIIGTIRDGALVPVSLATIASVKFQMKRVGDRRYTVNAAAEIIDAPNGKVRYTWADNDLNRPGDYEVQWELTYASGIITTTQPPNTLTVREQ